MPTDSVALDAVLLARTGVFAIRNTRKSIIANLAALFVDTSKLTYAFNIYYDANLLAQTVVTRPSLFIVNFGLLYEAEYLPVVSVNPKFRHVPHELGSSWGWCDLELHVFGRNRDEADDVAGAIMHHIADWTLYDYSSGSAVSKGATPIDGYWDLEYVPVGAEFAQEGTADHWEVLTCSFLVPYYT